MYFLITILLDEWIAPAQASMPRLINRIASLLIEHTQQVQNFFRYRLNSGRIESLNSMISHGSVGL